MQTTASERKMPSAKKSGPPKRINRRVAVPVDHASAKGSQGSGPQRADDIAALRETLIAANVGAPAQQPQAAPARKPAPAPTAPAASGDFAAHMLKIEDDLRRAETDVELGYIAVNAFRTVLPFRQAILVAGGHSKKQKVEAVSSLAAIDRNSTFIRWIEGLTAQTAPTIEGAAVQIDLSQTSAGNLDATSYPFTCIAMMPLRLRDGSCFAHILFAGEKPWADDTLATATRLTSAFSHAWQALSGPQRLKRKTQQKTRWGLMAACCALATLVIPVPLTALAPAEVTAANAFVVAAPIDGIVDTVAVAPNSTVKSGDLLFTFNDTDLRNRLKLAGQAVSVAEARYQQAVRTSFADERAKRELAIAQSELALKASEYDYARELLDNSEVRAARDGVVVFASKDDWTGRPVSTGERIMRIADPANTELTIDLPVADAIVLDDSAPIALYLDSDPLTPIAATLRNASYHARPDGEGVLSYRVAADLDAAAKATRPRIGLRGTAKIYGDDVSLGYYLLRKPIAAVRQWTGL